MRPRLLPALLLCLLAFRLAPAGPCAAQSAWPASAAPPSALAQASSLSPGPARAAQAIPVYRPRLLKSYPHNRAHFTQGLFFYQGRLYESTGLYGQSVLAAKNPQTGRILKLQALDPRFFGEGSCQARGRIYLLTWREQTCLIFDAQSLRPLGSFAYSGEGWGLAWNGRQLVRSDGSSRLYLHDLDGTEAGSLEVTAAGLPVTRLNELEWLPQDRLLLANIWESTRVAAIDLETGLVRYWLELAELTPQEPGVDVLNGLALAEDGKSLWLTGKLWPVIHQIAWPPGP